jgi:phosphoenolpyruvate carboxykinase (GTP)
MEAVLHVDTGEWKSEIPLIEDWFATIGPKLPIEIDLEFEKLRAKVLAQDSN